MNRVIAFYGADHKVGTSMLAQCVAERLGEQNPDAEILLVHAQDSRGTEYSPMVTESMEHIRPYLAENIIDTSGIKEKARWKGNVSIIGGPDDPFRASDFHPGVTELLIKALADHYNYVICDCGAELAHGLAMGALAAADKRYIVLSQTESCLRRYEWMAKLYTMLGVDTNNIIVNMYDRNSPYGEKYIKTRLKLENANVLKLRPSKNGSYAESESRSLLSFRESCFIRDTDALIKDIVNEL